jgi:hypothetical protein
MPKTKQLSVFCENRPGTLAHVAGADVRMIQSRCGTGLSLEAFDGHGVGKDYFRQKLQSDEAS